MIAAMKYIFHDIVAHTHFPHDIFDTLILSFL